MAGLTPLSPGAKVALAGWLVWVGWDLICPPRQTVSEAVARGLADPRTRLPIATIAAVSAAHVVALAMQEVKP